MKYVTTNKNDLSVLNERRLIHYWAKIVLDFLVLMIL